MIDMRIRFPVVGETPWTGVDTHVDWPIDARVPLKGEMFEWEGHDFEVRHVTWTLRDVSDGQIHRLQVTLALR